MRVFFFGGPLHGTARNMAHAQSEYRFPQYGPLTGERAEVRYTVRLLSDGRGPPYPDRKPRRWRVAVLEGLDPAPDEVLVAAVDAGWWDGIE